MSKPSVHIYHASAPCKRVTSTAHQACKEAGSKDVEIACQCDHGLCPLTV